MRTKLVPIGNSKGLRLPKSVIEQCGLDAEVELEVKKDHLIVRAAPAPRAGWDAAFARMARRGDDALLDADSVARPSEWDEKEWTW